MGADDKGISVARKPPQPAMRPDVNQQPYAPNFHSVEPEEMPQQTVASQRAASEPMGGLNMPCQPPLGEEWRNNSVPAAARSDIRAGSSAEALAQHAASHARSAESQLVAALIPDDVLDVWLQVRHAQPGFPLRLATLEQHHTCDGSMRLLPLRCDDL